MITSIKLFMMFYRVNNTAKVPNLHSGFQILSCKRKFFELLKLTEVVDSFLIFYERVNNNKGIKILSSKNFEIQLCIYYLTILNSKQKVCKKCIGKAP